MYVSGIDFPSFYDFVIGISNFYRQWYFLLFISLHTKSVHTSTQTLAIGLCQHVHQGR